jgi:hypothetical protein
LASIADSYYSFTAGGASTRLTEIPTRSLHDESPDAL